MEILYAFLILAGLGLLFGIGLVVFGHKFRVKEDERVGEVEKMLPNYNCGACGYAGCHDMANALVSGKEKQVNKCKPGKPDKNYDPILAYLKEHPEPIHSSEDE